MTATTRIDIVMPRLSDSMEEGVLLTWLVADGDHVDVGQEIAEIETDKATMSYESEAAGKIHLLAQEGDTVAVGALIAVLGDPPDPGSVDADRSEPASDGAPVVSPQTSASPMPDESSANGARPSRDGRRPNASPVARRIAAASGIDLGSLAGSGPGGRIVKADVVRARPAPEAAPEAPSPDTATSGPRRQELTRLQTLIARRMVEAKTSQPEFALQTTVDMESCVALRTTLRKVGTGDAPLPSYNDFVIKACAVALREHPLANGAYVDDGFELHDHVNVGFAVAADDALLVPTVRDADRLPLGHLAQETRRLADRVRSGTVTPQELSGGTFSISNLGMFGVESFTAVLNPPQAAILAVGTLKKRAVVHEDVLCARHAMSVTLTCDHRILYGAPAGEFLSRIKNLLEGPAALML